MSRASAQGTVEPFEHDVRRRGGYHYTSERLSCRLANERISDAVLAGASFAGRRVIDVGCGDGTYTCELAALARPALIHGIDPAGAAIAVARERVEGDAAITFDVASAYELPHEAGEFDVGVVRGVLHHVDEPRRVIAEALRVAPTVVVVEPNGLNPGLKLLERVSAYHVDHEERSYPPIRLDRWVREQGGRTICRQWVGFVPMFAPDVYARAAKRIEPLLEALPGARSVLCAQYVFTARRQPTTIV